jgi:tetratricopeptide (TPR) repeat protein
MATPSEAMATAKAHHQAGSLQEAEQVYRQILAAEPTNVDAWHLLGVVAWQLGEPEAAAECIGRALELKPDYAEGHNSLGIVLQAQGRLEEAVARYRRAVELDPLASESHYNLGLALQEQEKLDDAAECYRRALDARPDHAEAYNNLGNILKEKGDLDEAIACHRRAAELKPEFAEAHYNLANALQEKRQWEEAAACYERALALRPDFADAHNNLSRMLLLLGDFERGWAEYEWRWETGQLQPREFSQPKWDGRTLKDGAILLHAEQGLGDTLQFIRYAPLVKERVGTVLFECERALLPLLSTCPGIDRFIEEGTQLPAFDVQALLLSLPGIFQTRLESIPSTTPYLFADSALVARWSDQLKDVRGFRVGINWHGRSGRGAHLQRDIPLDCFAPLAEVPSVRLVSLQKESGSGELAALKARFPIFDPGADVDTRNGAFMDTAAIMMNLDLVITSDTSVAHLAGALGVPVWVGLAFAGDWRWLLDRNDSPWYPTMRLFRQSQARNWAPVFEEMREELARLVVQ